MPQFAIDPHSSEPTDKVAITPEVLSQMMDDLFVCLLDQSIDTEPRPVGAVNDDAMIASVQIQGEFNCEVAVVATPDLAQEIACAMFGMESEDLAESEIKDALGEIANVIGGNIKGVVDKDCDLSLPQIEQVNETHTNRGRAFGFELFDDLLTIILVDG